MSASRTGTRTFEHLFRARVEALLRGAHALIELLLHQVPQALFRVLRRAAGEREERAEAWSKRELARGRIGRSSTHQRERCRRLRSRARVKQACLRAPHLAYLLGGILFVLKELERILLFEAPMHNCSRDVIQALAVKNGALFLVEDVLACVVRSRQGVACGEERRREQGTKNTQQIALVHSRKNSL